MGHVEGYNWEEGIWILECRLRPENIVKILLETMWFWTQNACEAQFLSLTVTIMSRSITEFSV
jgi:hypothetical protein